MAKRMEVRVEYTVYGVLSVPETGVKDIVVDDYDDSLDIATNISLWLQRYYVERGWFGPEGELPQVSIKNIFRAREL